MTREAAAPAELLFTHGELHTMAPAAPRAQALAVRGGRIQAVGASAELERWRGPDTRVIDLRGGALTPGLVDGHCHLYGMGHALETLSLRGLASAEAVAQAALQAARELAPGEWLIGRGWDHTRWPGQEFPDCAALDRALPERPAALRRIDGHALWVNSAALRLAGIGPHTPDTPGGALLRRPDGSPTGVLIDDSMDRVQALIPQPSLEVRQRRILRAARFALSHGLVGVHEMGIDAVTLEAYRKLAASQQLPLRAYVFLDRSALEGIERRRPDADPDGTAMLTVRGLKLFADGALGSRGSWLLEPYSDDPCCCGLVLTDAAELERAVRLLAPAGWQLAVHAIGDAANRAVLDAVERGAGAIPELRFRIEHVQVIAPEDMARMARLGVIASVQPAFATSDMRWAQDRVGASRIRGAYAWRSLLEAGARLSGGSDFPIEEVPPLLGLYAAVTRQDAAGNPPGGWRPEERLTLDEAIRLFTSDAAFASFSEAQRGVLAPGYVADLTAFDGPLRPDRSLLERAVEWTVVGGAIAYERAADAPRSSC